MKKSFLHYFRVQTCTKSVWGGGANTHPPPPCHLSYTTVYNTLSTILEPSMRNLTLIRWTERGQTKEFRLPSKASGKWRAVGKQLNITSNDLDGYYVKHNKDQNLCWDSVMTAWLQGQAANLYPLCWESLYKLLDEVLSGNIAAQLREAVEKASKCN